MAPYEMWAAEWKAAELRWQVWLLWNTSCWLYW